VSDRELHLRVNGSDVSVSRTPERTLLSVLRTELGLTGTKYGCGEGECGSCTVIVDGETVRACQTRLSEAAGRHVTTVEGLAHDGRLSPVQRAFAEVGAFQCGYCTPGMIVAATALLRRNPTPSRDEIETALDGNLCRCCGYPRILAAVERAAALRRDRGEEP
jgi:aerobic-type carbon monoxide dehydrogenase small subunit (CoxS/CutS family)